MTTDKTWESSIAALKAKEAEARAGGGVDRLQKLRERGRLTARERIDYILDANSFVELNMLAEHQCHDFGMEKKKFLGDGVITGHGTIRGRRVARSARRTVRRSTTSCVSRAKQARRWCA
jgi:acetyl-CoA carboxylase carboxyltransferase component